MALALRRTRFVGRTGELARLAAALASRGECPALVVAGEAGIGKTRLVREFARSVEDGGGLAIIGGCLETGGELLPYAPFVEALDSLRDRLGDDLFKGPAGSELATLVPALGSKPASGPEPLRLFEAVRWLLDRTPDPTLLVLEDIHWADRSSLVLLSYLVRRIRPGRVLLVATVRCDELTGDHPAGPVVAELVRGERARRIDLPPLPDVDVQALVDAVAPGVDAITASAIVARSEGSPFFAEALASDPSGHRGSIPATLRDDLLARVDRAPAEARSVLELVAVVGRPAGPALLRAAWTGTADALEEGVRAGLELGLLVRDVTASRVALRHSLVGQAIEERMSPLDQARAHERLATLLEERRELAALTEAGRTAELAGHWRRAGRDADALRSCVAAALAADEVPARAEAWSQFEAAIDLWARLPDAAAIAGIGDAQLLCRAARAASLTGNDPRAIELETLAIGAAAVEGAVAVGEHYATLAEYDLEVRDIEGMVSHASEAIARIPASPPSRERGFALWALARSTAHAGDIAGALGMFREAVAVAQSVSDPVLEARARSTYGSSLWLLDHQETAMGELDRAALVADATRDPAAARAAHLNRLGALFEGCSGVIAAERALEAYRCVARQLDLNADDEIALGAVLILELGGDWEDAEDRVAALLESGARPTLSGPLLLERGVIRALTGRFDAADLDLRTALAEEQADPALEPTNVAAVHQALAEAALQRKAPAEALNCVDDALAALRGQCYPVETLTASAFGVRAAADLAEIARSHHARDDLERALVHGRSHRLRLEAGLAGTLVAGIAAGPRVRAACAWGLAEASRMEGTVNPQLWAEAADRLSTWRYPQLVPYARFRAAEALLAGEGTRAAASTLLAEAYRRASELRMAPLCADIEALARRARLHGVTAVVSTGPAADHGLSAREREVLELLIDGRTNREIGAELFISEKTASVHVTHILDKLGVNSRGAAAAFAARSGLIKVAAGRDGDAGPHG
jgi:DNA-binding CsgD family transcriptional regulator/tetratricopeptide (TPR) repeat protein